MEKTVFLTVLMGLLLVVSALQTFQLNSLNTGMVKFSTISSPITTGSSLASVSSVASAGSGDAAYQQMMDSMHPGWRGTQGAAAAQQAPASAPAQQQSSIVGQLNNLPSQVGGC